MSFLETIRIAVDSLLRQKTRALLTMLGIIIGVGAVISMVAVGQGAQSAVESQIASLGTNVLIIYPGSTSQGGARTGAGSRTSLTMSDVNAIRDQCPSVALVSPNTRVGRQVVAGNLNWGTSIQGGSPEYFQIRDWQLALGDYFTEQDERGATKVCVLGQTVVQNLFPGQDPVGQIVRIGNMPFVVTGTLISKGQTAWGQDQDDMVVAPFATVQRKIQGVDHVSTILISAASKELIPSAQREATEILRVRHKIQPWDEDDFTIRNQSEIAAAATATSSIMQMLLVGVALVSLLVGGIGIMNIMLVSVTERTREIGIRMSIGARRFDILWQFLIESIMLSVVGGIIGIGMGFGVSNLFAQFAGWPVVVSPLAILLAFIVSASVGIFFGFYPARKASSLSPIDALRFE